MKKIYLFKMFLMAFVLMLLGGVNASAEISKLIFTKACGGSGTADDKVIWTVASDADESEFDNSSTNKGIHYGTGKKAVSYLTLTTSGISGTISKIVVNASGASKTSAKLDVTVGGSTFGSQETLTSTATDYTFEGSATGEIVVKLSQTSATKALYVKSISVTYETSSTPTTNFKYSAIEYNAVLGGTNTFPTLTNDYDTEVTYNSSNTSVATIDTEGIITLEGVGTTTITATLNANNSVKASYTLNVAKKTNSITFSNGTDTYVKAPVSVELSASVAGSTIYYSTDGNKPTKDEEHKYSSPINITKSGTVLKVLATAQGYDDAEAEATYTIKPDQPLFSEDSKTFKDPLNVTLSLPETTDATSKIYYAIGSTATAESTLYDGTPITIEASNEGEIVRLHAVVVDEYGNVGKE